ncbi:MAG: nucleotidyltransferase domain-containing protein [Oscillospiraceae bacterium]|nr:nucleotidyltransferase domain-containing protein [Oscillospiraceae bacterium]
MNETQRIEINEIVNSILTSVPVSEIYLFGSYARGTAKDDSDYDFYIVIPDDGGMRELEASRAIRRNLRGKRKRSIDMLVGKQSKFNRRKEYFYSIENEIKETGVKLHG